MYDDKGKEVKDARDISVGDHFKEPAPDGRYL